MPSNSQASNTVQTLAQAQIVGCNEMLLAVSNRLDQSLSASSAFSNQLAEAQATHVLDTDQITNLTRQVAAASSEKEGLDRRVMELTNQAAGLTSRITAAETNLNQANRDYALLENRLRRDVAERVVVERKFNNPSELQAQMQNLKKHPAGVISADGIYAGLDVEVQSNAFHVIAPE